MTQTFSSCVRSACDDVVLRRAFLAAKKARTRRPLRSLRVFLGIAVQETLRLPANRLAMAMVLLPEDSPQSLLLQEKDHPLLLVAEED
jgi:hypothetical protein